MQYLETYSKAPLSRRLVKTEFLQYKVYNCSSTILFGFCKMYLFIQLLHFL